MDKKMRRGKRRQQQQQQMSLQFLAERMLCCCLLLLPILLVTLNGCNCAPRKTEAVKKDTIRDDRKQQTWKESIFAKLDHHVKRLEFDLEEYLNVNYLPYLRIVGALLDFESEKTDSGMARQTRVVLRVTTIHAYLVIHQTALTYASVQLLKSYLNSKDKDYTLSDSNLNAAFAYLNLQIRTYTLVHKSAYLHEFAFLCSKYEAPTDKPLKKLTGLQKLIDFLKTRTNFSRTRTETTSEIFVGNGDELKLQIKLALEFKLNEESVNKFADEFYSRNGLEALISGYLFMSYDQTYLLEVSRKFNFRKYFNNCKTGNEEKRLKANNIKIDTFDPSLPNKIADIDMSEIKSKFDTNLVAEAKYMFRKRFYNELIEKTLPLEENQVNLFGSLMENLQNSKELINLIKDNDKNKAKIDDEDEETISAKIFALNKMVTEYQLLKISALNRFTQLAKYQIGYATVHSNSIGSKKLEFRVPFNNSFFALKIQKLLLAFYPVMMSQASFATTKLADFSFDKHKQHLIQMFGKNSIKSKKAVALLDEFYNYLQTFRKREEVVANINMHYIKLELKKFHDLPSDRQGYFVAMNNFALGHILALHLEPTYNEMNNLYDLVQKHIVECLLKDHIHTELAISGKSIECNVKRWLIITPDEPEDQ